MYNRGKAKSLKHRLIELTVYSVVFAVIGGGTWFLDHEYNIFSDNVEYDRVIEKAALRHNLDSLLVKAVIWRESRFKPHARGYAGEIGLMQIMPKSATKASVVEDWERANGVRIKSEGNLFYPETNIDIGAWYLARAIKHWEEYKYKYEIALCEYNAGKSNVNKWVAGMEKHESILGRIQFASTHDYVKAIMVKYHYYKTKENEKY